ncbi:hypothetical protein [Marinobacter sp.]|uniref:hypothetical protein n=1 Tax=Marinobacter sp. TaxID=50741 RepID=UPI0035C68D84
MAMALFWERGRGVGFYFFLEKELAALGHLFSEKNRNPPHALLGLEHAVYWFLFSPLFSVPMPLLSYGREVVLFSRREKLSERSEFFTKGKIKPPHGRPPIPSG